MNISCVAKESCTGCGACRSLCPKSCIEMSADEYGNIYPLVDTNECIDCGKCTKVCPSINPVELYNVKKAFAGWHANAEVRRLSASGGVASALYDYFQSINAVCYGVILQEGKCYFEKSYADDKASDKFRNSKYVHTEIGIVIADIINELKNGNKVFCVGVPCQIAAIRNCIGTKYESDITLVDLICHGMTSLDYLNQHVSNAACNRKVDSIYFRNPMYGTENYHFTLEDSKGIFYNKTVADADEYQIGYHKGIIYRDNCYHCRYAKVDRVGDITLADYWGLGKDYPWHDTTENVNLVYGVTDKGLQILNEAEKLGFLVLHERPIKESVSTQGQLNKPTSVTVRQKKFRANYKRSKDFDSSIQKSMKWDIKFLGTPHYSKLLLIRRIIKKIFKVEL